MPRKPKLYIASWATPEDLDCERDDSQFDSVADLASPRGVVLRGLSKATLTKVRAMALDEVTDGLDAEDTAPYLRGRWEQDFEGQSVGRGFWHWCLVDPDSDGEPLITVVIQEATVI